MSVASDFRTDLRHADAARQRLDENFYPYVSRDGKFVPVERSAGSIFIQKHCHVDCIAAAKRGGSVTIEEKIVRWKGRRYTAMTVETHSNLERTIDQEIGDGWIATCTADYLLYAFQQEDKSLLVWLFDLPKFRKWFNGVFQAYAISDTSNDFYTTRCRVVPLRNIPDECVKLRNRAA